MKYLKGFQTYLVDFIALLKFSKGHNSVKMKVEFNMIIIFCILSDNALYLYQVSWKYFKVIQSPKYAQVCFF